jgi:hypothetical protein
MMGTPLNLSGSRSTNGQSDQSTSLGSMMDLIGWSIGQFSIGGQQDPPKRQFWNEVLGKEVMATSDPKINDYDRLQLGDLRVLSFQITQVPFELGESSQAVQIELLRRDCLRKIAIQFSNVVELKIADLHPGVNCRLYIVSIADAQMDGIRYLVFNGEQDLTLRFHCEDFTVDELEL